MEPGKEYDEYTLTLVIRDYGEKGKKSEVMRTITPTGEQDSPQNMKLALEGIHNKPVCYFYGGQWHCV